MVYAVGGFFILEVDEMTQEEFDNTDFGAEMRFTYRGVTYDLAAVNFEERLLGLTDSSGFDDESDDDIAWVRCENSELIK